MTSYIETIVRYLCQYPKRSTLVILSLLSLMAPLVISANFSNSYKDFVGSENSMLDSLYEIEDEFGEYNNAYIMLRPKNGVLNPAFLSSLIDLTDKAWSIENIKRVDSLTNFQHTEINNDELIISDLFSTTILENAELLKKSSAAALSDPEILNYFINPEATAAAINIDFIMDEGDLVNVIKGWHDIEALIAQYEANNPNVDIAITGVMALNIGFLDALKNDLILVLPLAFTLIFIGISVLFRNITMGLITLLIAAISTLASMALVGFTGWILVPFTTGGVIIIMILAVADCSHVISAANQNILKGMNKKTAIVRSITHNLRGLSLTTLTTAIGFLSFTTSEFEGIFILGCYVAFGICFALLLAIVLLPPLLMLVPLGKNKQIIKPALFIYLAQFIIQYRWLLLILVVPTVVISGFLSVKNELNDSLADNMASTTHYNIAAKKTEEHLSGSSYLLYNIKSANGDKVSSINFFSQVDAFKNWLETQPEVRFIKSYTSTLKRLNQNLHNGDPSHYALPQTSDEAAQYLLLYEMSLPYGSDLTNQVNLDKTKAILNVNISDQSIKGYKDLNNRITAWLNANAPELITQTSGTNYMMSQVLATNFYEMLFGAIVALGVICLILVIAMRSLYAGLICSIGVIAPIWVCFGAWALTSGIIGLAASYVISMAVGIAVDNSVHFMSKYLYAMQNERSKPDAISYAFAHVGEAITINTLVLGACFATLITSSFLLYSVMGLMTVIMLALALLATFFLIPALLMVDLPKSLKKYTWISGGS